MNLYDKITNIREIDKNKIINEVIREVRNEYQKLTTKRTCVIYSSLIYILLKQKHITTRIINTKDLGFNFEHQFCLVPYQYKEYYLIDLAYEQFNNKNFEKLLLNGYIIINDLDFNKYLNIVTNNKNKDIYELDNVFYESKPYEIIIAEYFTNKRTKILEK